jgi:hypothetical protein
MLNMWDIKLIVIINVMDCPATYQYVTFRSRSHASPELYELH